MDKLKLVASWIPIVLVALPMIAGGAKNWPVSPRPTNRLR